MSWIENSLNSQGEYCSKTPMKIYAPMCIDQRLLARRNSLNCRSNPKSKHCCYSAVKYALLSMGLVDHRLGGARGYMAAKELKKEGWKEKSCAARKKPVVGMVCTYRGYTNNNGHAEVWRRCPSTGKMGWYYGISCSQKPLRLGCFSCKLKESQRLTTKVKGAKNKVVQRKKIKSKLVAKAAAKSYSL